MRLENITLKDLKATIDSLIKIHGPIKRLVISVLLLKTQVLMLRSLRFL